MERTRHDHTDVFPAKHRALPTEAYSVAGLAGLND